MFYHNIDPVLFSLGPIAVRWYGVIFVIGIFLTYLIFKHLAKRKKLPLSAKDFDDYLMYGVIGSVVGARLGSVVSELPYYLSNPLQVFAVWNGGMAFHGGLIGAVLAGYLFCRRRNINFYDVADLTVVPAALALAFGRIANFINGEFYGTATTLPWAVKFQGVEGFRHPVQLYESVKNFAIFGILWSLKDRNLPRGATFWLFISIYSGLRFITEFFKDLPFLLFGLTWGQLWSLPLFIIGSFMLYSIWRRKTVSS